MKSLILGHRGMVGSALHRLIPDAHVFRGAVHDYRRRELTEATLSYFSSHGPLDALYLCAARVGGIGKNLSSPGEMIYDNLMIQTNVIEAARLAGVKLIVFLGSSCIYPSHLEDLNCSGSDEYNNRWDERDLLRGPLEPSNEPYAIAKIAGIKMLEAYKAQYGMEYLAVMPCNLYGPGDNFDRETSHFLPAMIRKFHDAKVSGEKSVTLWGTGKPRRELMHVEDCARIITELVEKGARGLINVGHGADVSISDYADVVGNIVGFEGVIAWVHSKPDGVMRKLLDVSRLQSFGCHSKIDFTDGISSTYQWFLENKCAS